MEKEMFAPDAPGELGGGRTCLTPICRVARPCVAKRRAPAPWKARSSRSKPFSLRIMRWRGQKRAERVHARGAELPRCGGMRHRPDSVRASHKPASRARIAEASCEGHEVRQSTGLGYTIHPSVHRLTHAAHRGCAFRAHASRSRPGYSRPVACGLVEVT